MHFLTNPLHIQSPSLSPSHPLTLSHSPSLPHSLTHWLTLWLTHLRQRGITFGVQVLSSGHWPSQKMKDARLPAELEACRTFFHEWSVITNWYLMVFLYQENNVVLSPVFFTNYYCSTEYSQFIWSFISLFIDYSNSLPLPHIHVHLHLHLNLHLL